MPHALSHHRTDAVRVPPQSIAAEQAVLGGLLLEPTAWTRVTGHVEEADFLRSDHRLIWRAIQTLHEQGRPFDAVTVAEWFEAQGLAERVGGGSYLIELASTTPGAANAEAYADIVHDKAVLRRLIEFGSGLVNDAFEPHGRDSADLIARAQQGVIELLPRQRNGWQQPRAGLQAWYDDLVARYQRDGAMIGLATPWRDLNAATGGLQPEELTLVAARPSMGKSVFGLNLAIFAAMAGLHVALVSLEMSAFQLYRRGVAALAKVPHNWLRRPGGNDELWQRTHTAMQRLRELPLSIDDSSDLSVAEVMMRARALHLERPVELLVVDHVHDFRINAREARFEVGKIAQGLKTLAKEFHCPVVGLAQLNRSLNARVDKRPTLADLRESGELEQKADLIVFLHREDYYDRNTHLQDVVELHLAKGRDLRAGQTIPLRNDFAHMRLRNWTGPLPEPTADSATPATATAQRWEHVYNEELWPRGRA
jgi:replicative DNA helicase